MDEKHAVLEAWNRGASQNEAMVLVTVTHVEGSAYRRPGAKMLLFAGGERVGSISGGCLETDVCQKAWWWTENGPHLRTYDTLTDEEAAQEFGLGCNGIVRVFVERVGGPEQKGDALRRFLTDRQNEAALPGVCATVIAASAPAYIGQRVFSDTDNSDSSDDPALCKAVSPHLHAALAAQKARTVSCKIGGETLHVFIEFAAPPQPLVIFGGGQDVIPLVRLAKTLGWHVTVVESRPAFALLERFPGADRVINAPASDTLPLVLAPRAAVLLMNHRYGEDLALLRGLLSRPAPPRYVGVLGPRTRAEKMLAEISPSPDAPPFIWPAFLHAPVGLDIGSDAPETIALSILAEIQAVLSNRDGGKLRHRSGPINEREPAEIPFCDAG